jgi:DNA-binding PadR family transcriptional regulator
MVKGEQSLQILIVSLLRRKTIKMSDSGQEALTEIRAHERECVLRYKAIENSLERGSKRFDKIEHMLWGIYIALFFTVLVPQALRFME